ncbi:MAG TPA: YkgJ family cysteine cluster protein [Thermoanaerobaculia bacterium]|nr:YkgJ family cysteine cluster protein [Thermoanaerobaculia bacterium]
MPLPFAPPPGVRFTCTRCGDCCRSWNVMLGPGEEERLAALDWEGREADLVGATTAVTSALPGGPRVRRLARHDDGACVYLGADNRCRIHVHFGGESKPLMCRLYPFGFYPLAGRLAVDCSFSCRSIGEGSGAGLDAQIPEWRALLAGGEPREELHHLTRGRALSGELLWEIEHLLVGLLVDRGLPLYDRIRCCLELVRLGTSGDPSTPSAAALRAALARGLPRQIGAIAHGGAMDRTQRAVFYQWLFLALNPVPAGFDLLAPTARQREERRRLGAAERFVRQEGAPWVDGHELPVDCAAVLAIDASLLAAAECPVMERYLVAKIVGQRFLLAGAVELALAEAVPLFFLVLPMAIWTARALAAARGAVAVAEADLRGALARLDRTLGQVPLAAVPPKVAKAWRFIIEETGLAVAATDDLLGIPAPVET